MSNFAQHLAQLVNQSMGQGVPAQEIILCLEITKIELVNSLLSHAHQAAATPPESPRIVLPGQD